MTSLQKVIKYLAMGFAVFLTVSIIGGILGAVGLFGGFFGGGSITGEMKTYSVSADVQELDIEIGAADVYIKEGDAFSLESNLKDLKVDEKNGTLTIKDSSKIKLSGSSSVKDAVLTLYIPKQTVFDNVRLSTGAGRLTVDALHSQSLDFDLGAGEVSIGNLVAEKSADIDGGAGRITVSGGELCSLDLDMGVGQLNLCSALSGSCKLDLGIGETNVTLIGSKDEYKLDIEKGIGSISIDGKSVSDYGSSGTGDRKVEINGGVGAINIEFKELDAK